MRQLLKFFFVTLTLFSGVAQAAVEQTPQITVYWVSGGTGGKFPSQAEACADGAATYKFPGGSYAFANNACEYRRSDGSIGQSVPVSSGLDCPTDTARPWKFNPATNMCERPAIDNCPNQPPLTGTFTFDGQTAPVTICYNLCEYDMTGMVFVPYPAPTSGVVSTKYPNGYIVTDAVNAKPIKACTLDNVKEFIPPPATPNPASSPSATSSPSAASSTSSASSVSCATTPTDPSCTSSASSPSASSSPSGAGTTDCPTCAQEGTLQGLINWLKSTTGYNTDFSANRDALKQHDADLKSKLQTVADDADKQQANDEAFIDSIFHFAPVANGCQPWSGSVRGVHVTIDICKYTEYIRELLAWLFALFGAYQIFQIIFRPRA